MPLTVLLLMAASLSANAGTIKPAVQDRQSYKIYVDKEGVMRRSDTKEEVSYYGTNYTLPFAHAYRAMGYLGVDRKKAIERDVYHMSRLGFNGFRLHLWDAELADSLGNLQDNEHLDLLDYLIATLEKHGIDIVLTAQTNFGNGYPERNIDTGAFTYDFPKCEIHDIPAAQKIQENYLRQLASHVNPYTGMSYSGDNSIIAMEINNEPCHSGNKKAVTAYINKMVKALKKGGFDKPILYNVSHNPEVTSAYYDADIQGTTYQWYPVGLVAGHERGGNFLPTVDSYDIPWKNKIKNYNKMARLVYEFDPGDLLYSYMYPTIARTFRKEGFQWITQFAYDPTDMAAYNTEYQTHFLNLAYTPAKALSMLIAGEAARNIKRGENFGIFPTDTVFGDFTVSYARDLSELNATDKFYYSNSTSSKPKDLSSLSRVAGRGSSSVISYEGTGAYFLDKTAADGIWRLEVMPDVLLVADPFEKPSLQKEVGKIVYRNQPITIKIPDLGDSFTFVGISDNIREKSKAGVASDGGFKVYPGVYLLGKDKDAVANALTDKDFMDSGITDFVAPADKRVKNIVVHNPGKYVDKEGNVEITAEIFGTKEPEAVNIYPSTVSFWSETNDIFPMEKTEGYVYKAVIPADKLGWDSTIKYNIVVTEDGRDTTFPQNEPGNPLDWDFADNDYYMSDKATAHDPAILLSPQYADPNIDAAMIPEAWNFRLIPEMKSPVAPDFYRLTATPENDGLLVIKRYVGEELDGAPQMKGKKEIVLKIGDTSGIDKAQVSLIGKNGATYAAEADLSGRASQNGLIRIPLSSLSQRSNIIVPAPYPSFLPRVTEIGKLPFNHEEIDFVQLIIPMEKGKEISASIEGIWLE